MTETTLTREDTGEFLPVHVADDTPPLLAALQKEREGKPVATWAEFDEGLTELRRRLIDGLGEADAVLSAGQPEPEPEPPSFPDAVLPAELDPVAAYMATADPDDERPGRWVNVAEDDLLPARIVRVGDVKLPRRNDTFERRGWTPEPRPAITEPEDHGAIDRWLQRADTRLRQSRFGRWLAERFTPVKEER